MPTATPSVISGFGVPYALEADTTASTLGQYGPIASDATVVEDALGRRPALTLKTTGEQTATTSLEIATQGAGHVGTGTFRVRRTISGTLEDTWIGANIPNMLTGFAGVGWGSLSNQAVPHVVTLPNDKQILVYRQTDTPFFNIAARTYSPSTDAFATAVNVVTGLDSSHNPSPALCLAPDPAGGPDPIILCAYWVADDTTNEAQIHIAYSRNEGATWGTWARDVLPAAIDINSGSPYYTLGRIRWTFIGSQAVMFVHVTSSAAVSSEQEHVYQYASADYGTSWTLVTTLRGYGYLDIVTVGAVAYLTAISAVASPVIYLWPVRDAFVSISGLTPTDLFSYSEGAVTSGSPSVFSYASMAMAARRDGVIVVLNIRCVSNSRTGHALTYDPATGTSTVLNVYGVSAERLWWQDSNASSTEYPNDLCASVYRGQVRAFGVMISGTGNFDDRITEFNIAGNSSVTLPALSSTGSSISPAWQWTSVPVALASVFGWTFTGAGLRSITTNTGWETLTTAASAAYYTRTVTASADQQVWQMLRVRVDSGGGVSSRVIACGIRAAGVGYGYEFELRFSTTQIRFRDVGGAADTTTITIDTNTTGVDILMAISGAGLASAWARVVGADELQVWTAIEEGYQLTDDAGVGGTTNVIMFGNRATDTATSRWIATGGNAGDSLGAADLASGPLNPQELRGIPYALSGAYAAAGVSLGATGGPAMVGESWIVYPNAEHPVRHLLPVGDEDSTIDKIGGQRTSATEPASAWWSTATTGYVQVRFRGSANRVHPALIAVHAEGLNAPDPLVRFYNYDSSTYTTIGTMTNTRAGLRFLRPSASSPTVQVDTSGTSSPEPYIRSASLRGSYFRFTAGGKVRPILDNTEGRWSNDGDAALVILTLGGIDGTEPTSGTSGTIIYSRATFLVAMTASAEYGAFALQWSSAPDIYESQIRCSILAVCPVEPLLYARDWGTAYKQEDPAEVTETRSGLRRGRPRMTAPRRILSLPLTTLWDQRPLLDPSNQTPIVYKAYSNASYPVAGACGDEFGKLLGAWRKAGGSQHPVVWLPRIGTSTATQTLIGEEAGFYCRVTSPPQFTDDYGRDTGAARADVFRGDVWTLEEEI